MIAITNSTRKLNRLRSILFCILMIFILVGCTSRNEVVDTSDPIVEPTPTVPPEYPYHVVEIVENHVGTTVQSQYDAIKQHAHMIAENARALGFAEDDLYILYAQELWAIADAQYQEDVDIIATVVYNEAWGGCSTRHRELVAVTFVNRMQNTGHDFGNVHTAYEVACQRNQYNPAYADPNSIQGQNARQDPEIWETCRQIAMKALAGEVECPPNVLFQSQHIQGEIYEIHETSYSTTYFCYGE